MSDDVTLPPHQPNTARNLLRRAWDWTVAESKMHPTIAAGIGGFFAGWLSPKIIHLIADLLG